MWRRTGEQTGIVYCATTEAVDDLYERLNDRGYPAAKYHGKLSGAERKREYEGVYVRREESYGGDECFWHGSG